MAKIFEVPLDGGGEAVLVAVKSPEDQIHAFGADDQPYVKLDASLTKAFSIVKRVAGSFAESVRGAPIDSAELEFGLSFTAKGSIYFVESEVESSFKVKIHLKPKGG